MELNSQGRRHSQGGPHSRSAPARGAQPTDLAANMTGLMERFFFRLPMEFFVLGLDVAARTMDGARRIAGTYMGVSPHPRPQAPLALGLRSVGESAVGESRPQQVVLKPKVFPPGQRPKVSRDSSTVSAPPVEQGEAAADQTTAGPCIAGETVVGGKAADTEFPTTKEDKTMSCSCDQDLSGCELKVVEYTIVSVDPYIQDCDRILAGPRTLATSDDMTDADFTAYAIALFLQEPKHPDVPKCDSQYLRVCYCVQCRLTMPCPDYEKQQVDALRSIAAELDKKNDKKIAPARGGKTPAK